jgi:hypothetical protein
VNAWRQKYLALEKEHACLRSTIHSIWLHAQSSVRKPKPSEHTTMNPITTDPSAELNDINQCITKLADALATANTLNAALKAQQVAQPNANFVTTDIQAQMDALDAKAQAAVAALNNVAPNAGTPLTPAPAPTSASAPAVTTPGATDTSPGATTQTSLPSNPSTTSTTGTPDSGSVPQPNVSQQAGTPAAQ